MILPFIPHPYPDEILGSWLYRVRLHNHPVSFKAFTRQFMSNNIVEAGWRDISIYNRSFDDILQALGTSFDESLIKLTTYPYWLRFHSEDNYSSENFKTAAPAPKLVLNRIKNRASRFSYLRSNVIRVCPLCLVENLELYGEPYLHRSHHAYSYPKVPLIITAKKPPITISKRPRITVAKKPLPILNQTVAVLYG